MKWTNKGYEFSYMKSKYEEILGTGIYVFGTGVVSRNMCTPLLKFDLVGGFIDNDIQKQGTFFMGKPIISLEEYMQFSNPGAIVIALNEKNEKEVVAQLESKGINHEKIYKVADFLDNMFVPMLCELKNKIYVELTQISLTERCTLKCKYCAHGCYAVSKDAEDLSLDEVKKSADYYFKFVDYVKYFVLIGGEPLLYKGLSDVVEYIASRYKDQIGRLQITTNGTIIPDRNLLNNCKKHNVHFLISNYTKAIARLEKRLSELVMTLENTGIKYDVFDENTQWMDYGFGHLDRKATEEDLINVFDACRTACHEVRGEKFYFCVMARSVSENVMNNKVGVNDYLDLSSLNPTETEDRKVFMEYVMGYSEQGYLEMCNHCNGAESYKYVIPAAEQIKVNGRSE